MRFKEIRTASGLTQLDLAEKSGVSLRMIQKYESGDRDIKKAQAETVVSLAKVLGTTAEELIK